MDEIAVVATENPVPIVIDGKRYQEILLCGPENVKLDRYKSGRAPVLIEHPELKKDKDGNPAPPVHHQAGVITDAWIDNRVLFVAFRMSESEDVKYVKLKVEEKIVRNVSPGYDILKSRVEGDYIYRELWEPFELSIVGIPADEKTGIRKKNCVERTRQMDEEEEKKDEVTPPDPVDPEKEEEEEEEAEELPEEEKEKPEEERQKECRSASPNLMQCLKMCAVAGLNTQESVALLGRCKTMDSVVDELAKRKKDYGVRNHRQVIVGPTPAEKAVTGIENAIWVRCHGGQPDENGRRFMGFTMVEMARSYLQMRNENIQGMDRMQLVTRALHTTSDFPNILANVMNKHLQAAYEAAPATYTPFVTERPVSDFKPISVVQMGDVGRLKKLNSSGEYTRVTVDDSGSTYELETYGEIIGFTRKMMINDDLSALSRIPGSIGVRVQELKNELFWAIITSNPKMGDNKALFHADHGNLAASGSVISIASLSAARAAMRQQRGLPAGKEAGVRIRVKPVWLVVPTELETKAEQFVSPIIVPDSSANVNPFSGKYKVLAEPILDDASALSWYVFSEATNIPMVEMAYLEGAPGPRTETRLGFDVDGVELKVSFDVAAKATDHRGFYKDPGAEEGEE